VVEHMLALAADAGERELLAQARLLRAVALVELGDRAGRTDLDDYCRLAEELGHAGARWGALSRRAAAALLAGRLEEARALAEEARQLGRRIGQPDADSVADAQLWELGRFDGRRAAAGTQPRPAPTDWPAWRAILLAEAGDLEAARATLAGFDPDRYQLRPGVVRSHDPWPLLVTAEAVALAGDRRQQAASYRALQPLAGSHTVVGGFVAHTGAADHHLGLLAAALGRPEAAAGHLRAAVELHQRHGATAWAALSGEHLRRAERLTAPPANVFRRNGQVWTLTSAGPPSTCPTARAWATWPPWWAPPASGSTPSSCSAATGPPAGPTRSWTARPGPPTGPAWPSWRPSSTGPTPTATRTGPPRPTPNARRCSRSCRARPSRPQPPPPPVRGHRHLLQLHPGRAHPLAPLTAARARRGDGGA
jgi:hypothetical protein